MKPMPETICAATREDQESPVLVNYNLNTG